MASSYAQPEIDMPTSDEMLAGCLGRDRKTCGGTGME